MSQRQNADKIYSQRELEITMHCRERLEIQCLFALFSEYFIRQTIGLLKSTKFLFKNASVILFRNLLDYILCGVYPIKSEIYLND